MVGLIILSLVKFSDGNIATCRLHFVNNGDLNGYTKAMIITMTAIIIALQLGCLKSRMAHNIDICIINKIIMNKLRRKQLDEIALSVDDLKEQLQILLYEEEEYLYYMPENLEGSEKYKMSKMSISMLEDAIGSFDAIIINIFEAAQ